MVTATIWPVSAGDAFFVLQMNDAVLSSPIFILAVVRHLVIFYNVDRDRYIDQRIPFILEHIGYRYIPLTFTRGEICDVGYKNMIYVTV